MAKPKPCPKCGKWYNPRFSGTEEMCGFCFVKERISEPKEELDDKQKVKIETEQPVIATKARTTLRPATKNAVPASNQTIVPAAINLTVRRKFGSTLNSTQNNKS